VEKAFRNNTADAPEHPKSPDLEREAISVRTRRFPGANCWRWPPVRSSAAEGWLIGRGKQNRSRKSPVEEKKTSRGRKCYCGKGRACRFRRRPSIASNETPRRATVSEPSGTAGKRCSLAVIEAGLIQPLLPSPIDCTCTADE
jgi:hypothetical protein